MPSDRPAASTPAGHDRLGGLARFVLRHRKLVVVFWLVIFAAGAATVGKTIDRLTVDLGPADEYPLYLRRTRSERVVHRQALSPG